MRSPADFIYHFLGDHDRAKEHIGYAEALALGGERGHVTLHDETSVRIIENGGRVDIYIESPMQADFQMTTPRSNPNLAVEYYLDTYGFNHRRDSMFPNGQTIFGAEYASFPSVVGPEWYYISDGIIIQGLYATTDPPASLYYPQALICAFAITSSQEDLVTNLDGTGSSGTVGGFQVARVDFQALTNHLLTGPHWASIQPYGVDRSDPANPVYRAAYAWTYDYGAAVVTETSDPPSPFTLQHLPVYHIITLHAVGKTFGQASPSYILGEDVHIVGGSVYDSSRGLFSSPLPALIPLGNNRVFAIYRKRIPDATKVFGGTFTLEAKLISTTSYTTTTPSVAALKSHLLNDPYNHGPAPIMGESLNGFFTESDELRVRDILETFARTQRCACVPLSQDETIILGERSFIKSTTLPYDKQVIAYSVTPTGITQKGVVQSYWSSWAPDSQNPQYTGTLPRPPSYGFVVLGMVAINATTLKAYLYKSKSEDWEVGLPFYYIGTFCYTSTDGGATWDAGVRCQFNFPSDMRNYRIAAFHYMGNDKDGNPIIAMPLTTVEPTDPNVFRELPLFDGVFLDKTLRAAYVMMSTDGVTFNVSAESTKQLDFYIPSGFLLYNEERGLGSLQDFGNYHEGYRPSPYRHLPDYYGTAGPISRDNSNDFGR